MTFAENYWPVYLAVQVKIAIKLKRRREFQTDSNSRLQLQFPKYLINIYVPTCLPPELDVKSKPQDHMRQFKLRFRDDYLNYFKIYDPSSETLILWSGGEIAKIFCKISLQTRYFVHGFILPRIGQVYLVHQKGKRRSWKIRIKTKKRLSTVICLTISVWND